MKLPTVLPAVVTTTSMAVALLVAGAAYAQLRTTGSGSGSATAASGHTAFHTMTATVAPGAGLYPGGSAPLTLNIDNGGNAYALTVTSVALDTSRNVTGCTAPAITISTGTWTGVSVPANSTTGTITIPGAVSMGAAATNDCQGVTLTIPVTLTGHS